MSSIDALLQNNSSFSSKFSDAGLEAPPTGRVAVVACMDARLDPAALLGLSAGQAHVIRNAGGVVTDDILRSLAISQSLLGTREVMLIAHTDCGLTKFAEDEIQDAIRRASGESPPMPMLAIENLESSVRESVETVRSCPYLPERSAVRGFVYDVATGKLGEVD